MNQNRESSTYVFSYVSSLYSSFKGEGLASYTQSLKVTRPCFIQSTCMENKGHQNTQNSRYRTNSFQGSNVEGDHPSIWKKTRSMALSNPNTYSILAGAAMALNRFVKGDDSSDEDYDGEYAQGQRRLPQEEGHCNALAS